MCFLLKSLSFLLRSPPQNGREKTHPLKTRIVTLLQALHFMRDWQANPFCRGFRHLSFPFPASWDLDFCPTPGGLTHRVSGYRAFLPRPLALIFF
jgi:hypothetical protein